MQPIDRSGSKAGLLNQPRLRPQHITYMFEPGAKGIIEQVAAGLIQTAPSRSN
jgi:hypothetical protein